MGGNYYIEIDPNAIILKTIDGGTTWASFLPETTSLLSSVFFTDTKTGYSVGGSGTILKTQDEGLTWTSVVSGISSNLTSVYFTDANTGYAAGWGGVLKTINGGLTWTVLPLAYPIKAVHFTDANTGYLVGVGGAILKTTNGGITFVEEPISLESSFNIYPNPANHKISIAINSNLQGETIICIFNMNGALLQQNKFQNQNLIDMDVSALAKGFYLVKIQTKKGIETKKMVVQ